jgi:hypothetical protein
MIFLERGDPLFLAFTSILRLVFSGGPTPLMEGSLFKPENLLFDQNDLWFPTI